MTAPPRDQITELLERLLTFLFQDHIKTRIRDFVATMPNPPDGDVGPPQAGNDREMSTLNSNIFTWDAELQ